MDSYGPWDLIHRYLLPDWWIIPIYTTLTAWLASVVWWRRAVRFGRSWAQRLLRIIDDAPAARRLALRCVVAIPFLLVPVITMACWYMLGTMVWSLFAGLFDPASPTTLSRNFLNVAATIYSIGAILFISWWDDEYDYRGLVAAFWASLILSVPLALSGAFFLLVLLLSVLFTSGHSPDFVWIGFLTIGAAMLSVLTLWVGSLAGRRGIEMISDAFWAANKSP